MNKDKSKSKYNYFLFPMKKTANIRHPPPFIAFDTENEPETGKFISAAIYGEYIDKHQRIHKVNGEYFEDRIKLQIRLAEIANTNPGQNAYRLVGFNTDYDLTYINEIVEDLTRLTAGSRLITANLKFGSKKGIRIYDCMNFVRGSLETWIETLSMEQKYGVVKLPLEMLKERNIMDAKATYYLIRWIEDFMVNNLNIPLQLTIGACSLYYFRKSFLKRGLIRNSVFLNGYERKAYKGGRVECFRRGLQKVKSYDVHKMYLSIMHDELVPLPQSARYIPNNEGFEHVFDGNRMFIAHVKVDVPYQYIPPLPLFSAELNKLIFPVGVFDGYFTSVELKEAVNRYGVKIVNVYSYVTYGESVPLFHDFAVSVYKTQQKYAESGSPDLTYMIKTVGNSLYGKLGEKHGGGQWVKLFDFPSPVEGCLISIHNGEEYSYIPGGESVDSTHTFPCIPAFITAYGRVKLLRNMKMYEEDVVYCDTDSNHLLSNKTTADIIDDTNLGGFGFEYECEQLYYRPKMYGNKRKGIPKNAELVALGSHNEYYVYKKPLKRTEAIRRHDEQNRWIDVVKKVSIEDDKRVWNGDASEPICVG